MIGLWVSLFVGFALGRLVGFMFGGKSLWKHSGLRAVGWIGCNLLSVGETISLWSPTLGNT